MSRALLELESQLALAPEALSPPGEVTAAFSLDNRAGYSQDPF